jgi:RNA polymerase sigma factor (sigma-70 family)
MVNTPTDKELILLARKDNKEAYEKLYKRYQKLIYKYAAYFLNDYEKYQDFKQDAFFALIDCVKKVKISSINNNFSLCTTFPFYLKNLRRKYINNKNESYIFIGKERSNKNYHIVKTMSLSRSHLMDYEKGITTVTDYIESHISKYDYGLLNLIQEYREKFLNTLSEREKEIILSKDARCQIKDMTNYLNISHEWLNILRKRILVKYRQWIVNQPIWAMINSRNFLLENTKELIKY